MRFSRSLKNFIYMAAVLVVPAGAHAAGSWNSQPSWASDSPAPSRRNITRERSGGYSPFSPGSNNLAIEVGQVFLMGDLATNYEDNLGSQIHYTYGVSDMFGFDSSIGYSSHSEGKYSMTTLLTGLRTNLSWYDRVIPYAVFGLGFYKPSIEMTPTTSISPVIFGLHLGPGVDLQLTQELYFGAALTFHDMFGTTKRTSQGIQDIGGTYTSFLVHAGMTF